MCLCYSLHRVCLWRSHRAGTSGLRDGKARWLLDSSRILINFCYYYFFAGLLVVVQCQGLNFTKLIIIIFESCFLFFFSVPPSKKKPLPPDLSLKLKTIALAATVLYYLLQYYRCCSLYCYYESAFWGRYDLGGCHQHPLYDGMKKRRTINTTSKLDMWLADASLLLMLGHRPQCHFFPFFVIFEKNPS